MEGKKKKRKVGGIILLCMSFLLVIVLTFTMTLAWFFDSDWTGNYVTMAGSVGIELRDKDGNKMHGFPNSGTGGLHFNISSSLAYPGQAIDCSARVYNNGGTSVTNATGVGSPCYVRARFIVFTDIGKTDGDADSSVFNGRILYDFLQSLINVQNKSQENYHWVYYQNTQSMQISNSGTSTGTIQKWSEGSIVTGNDVSDKGYFYLCMKSNTDTALNNYLYSLPVGQHSTFLWNSQFILPWQLTNVSADKHILVAVEFQAIQTFIPQINDGIILSAADNQAFDNKTASGERDTKYDTTDSNDFNKGKKYYVNYNNISVQTVFNSINFRTTKATDIYQNLIVDKINFGDSTKYTEINAPSTPTPDLDS